VSGHRYLFAQLVRRELRRKYKGSSLGVLWYLINPLVLLGAYTLMFGHVFRLQHFADFPIFLMVGLMAWTFFAQSLLAAAESLIDQGSIVRLARWAIIEPDTAQVYSTRPYGRPITAVKRGLVLLLRQYIGQVSAQQSHFNAQVAAHVLRLEERVAELERAAAAEGAAELEPAAGAERTGEVQRAAGEPGRDSSVP
jgi:hypothetical protein